METDTNTICRSISVLVCVVLRASVWCVRHTDERVIMIAAHSTLKAAVSECDVVITALSSDQASHKNCAPF